MTAPILGPLVHSFVIDGLLTMKGLRPASVRSYRDVLRLFLRFVAQDTGRTITRLTLTDLSFERVLRFVRYLEDERRNHIRTRNQRLACLHTFFDYLAGRMPEVLEVAQRVAAIPMKRVAPPETRFLERDEIDALFASLPVRGTHALRDRALLLFLITPAPGFRRWPICALRISTSRHRSVCACMAKVTSGARARCGRTPPSTSAVSSSNARRALRMPRCSPRTKGAR